MSSEKLQAVQPLEWLGTGDMMQLMTKAATTRIFFDLCKRKFTTRLQRKSHKGCKTINTTLVSLFSFAITPVLLQLFP
ncbi:MAG: hypothetical protein ABH870_07360 [bacterium]